MKSKISSISEKRKKHHAPWFVTKYPREPRDINISLDNIPDDLKPFYPPPAEGLCYGIADVSSLNGFDNFKEVDLHDALPHYYNPMLVYRLLKSMYGYPDVVGAFLDYKDPKNCKLMPVDWSYAFRLDDNIIAEIRSCFLSTKHIIRFWTNELPEENPNQRGKESIPKFGQDLFKAVSNNLHFFSEKEELGKGNNKIQPFFENSFAVKYKSAGHFLDLAEQLDTRPQQHTLQWNENPEVKTVGSMYMASVLFYIIALETLLNLIYEIFLREEYRAYPYPRITNKADLEIRLSTIHLFCSCFEQQAVSPKSELWEHIKLLRDFRNDIVHGNITGEHSVHCLVEDGIPFYYSPVMDFRGMAEENKADGSLPRKISSIDKGTTMHVKEIVDELISNLLNAMDKASRSWVEGWLYELTVPSQYPKT